MTFVSVIFFLMSTRLSCFLCPVSLRMDGIDFIVLLLYKILALALSEPFTRCYIFDMGGFRIYKRHLCR